MSAALSLDGATLTVTIPLTLRKHGGRKQVVAPAGAPAWAPRRPEIDSTLVKALARAFRWRRFLEDGIYANCNELAAAERINGSYVSRVLRLTLLSPAVMEQILGGGHSRKPTLARLLKPFPVEWARQAEALTAE
jgi:hypothetical protein